MGGRALIALAALTGSVAAAAVALAGGLAAPTRSTDASTLRGERFRLTLPAGWTELPALVPSKGDEADGVVERRGLGDPGTGCFAIVQVGLGKLGSIAAMHGRLDRALAKVELTATPTPAPTAPRSTIALAGLGVEGRVTSELTAADDALVSLACFDDRREPEACRRQCEALQASLQVGP